MNNKFAIIRVVAVLSVAIIVFGSLPGSSALGKDLSNPVNLKEARHLQKFDLSFLQRQQLENNGFVFSHSTKESFYGLYNDNRSEGVPSYITTDLVLHTAHLLYNYSLKSLEYKSLSGKVNALATKMVNLTRDQYGKVESEKLKEAARLNLAFFSVAKKLMSPDWSPPEDVTSVVNEEVKLINRNTEVGLRSSELMGYKISYSSFLPRGHYARSEELRNYFKVINWFGQVYFRLKPGNSPADVEKGREETLSSLLMVKLLRSNRSALDLWKSVNGLFTDFVGPPDNLQVNEYSQIAAEVFGEEIGYDKLQDQTKLNKFLDLALKKADPVILPVWAASQQVPRSLSQGFCFLSKRFDLSSEIFQNLVYPNVGTQNDPRNIPKGLDVMAAFGSPIAEDILKEEGEFTYANYRAQLTRLKKKYGENNWNELTKPEKSLKGKWMGILRNLVSQQKVQESTLMSSEWDLKQLNTALGAWTEIKHDTVLYSKQSTAMARGVVSFTKGYVEPRPNFYGAIGDLAEQLSKMGSLPSELRNKLDDFSQLVRSFENIAEAEIAKEQLTEDQYETIFDSIEGLSEIATPPAYLKSTEGYTRGSFRTALAVDVHRDPQTNLVLQEAIGNPFMVIVLVETDAGLRLARGGTYSHYEFTNPSEELLTDETWIQKLESSDRPSTANWLEPLFSQEIKFPELIVQ